MSVDDEDLAPRLLVALDRAWEEADEVRAQIAQGVQMALMRLDGMGAWLRDQVDVFVENRCSAPVGMTGGAGGLRTTGAAAW